MRKPEVIGPYLLRQSDGVFPLTGDTLALGRFASVHRGDRVCDLGCGSGALMLLLACRAEELAFTGVDNSEEAAGLAAENLRGNGLSGRVICCGVTEQKKLPPKGSFDLVVCNPPYYPHGSGGDGGRARMEGQETPLASFLLAGASLLRNGGKMALCGREDRLTDLLCGLRNAGLEPKRICARSPLLLLEAVKNARPGGLSWE